MKTHTHTHARAHTHAHTMHIHMHAHVHTHTYFEQARQNCGILPGSQMIQKEIQITQMEMGGGMKAEIWRD